MVLLSGNQAMLSMLHLAACLYPPESSWKSQLSSILDGATISAVEQILGERPKGELVQFNQVFGSHFESEIEERLKKVRLKKLKI